MQVFHGNPDVLGQTPVTTENAEHRARRAMVSPSIATREATAASAIDFHDHATPGQIVRREGMTKRFVQGTHFDDSAEDLMSQNAAEVHVAASELEVGVANPGGSYGDHCFTESRLGRGKFVERNTAIGADERLHGTLVSNVVMKGKVRSLDFDREDTRTRGHEDKMIRGA